jgi:hypothetical protein
MAKRGCKTHFTFDDLNGKTIEFDIPNESGHNYWGRGELEVEEIVNGLIDIKVVTVSIDDEKLEMLVKRSLTQKAVDRLVRNYNKKFADFQLYADGGTCCSYWHPFDIQI